MEFKVPQPLKEEHEELHTMLKHATDLSGKTGKTAKKVAVLMHPHFIKEEQYALPPLGLLPALAAGKFTPEMKNIIIMTDKLKVELPEMLKEHQQIVEELKILMKDAAEENHPEIVVFADKLMLHAQTEEEVYYPAAILAGEFIKLKLGQA